MRGHSPQRRTGSFASSIAVVLLALALGGTLASCGDWVSLGPLVECGRVCTMPRGVRCEFGQSQYNRAGECVCGAVVDCAGYVCTLSPEDPTCYIAQYAASGECSCTVRLAKGRCGQPCTPGEALKTCDGRRFEYNESGECVCSPAKCPCGEPCVSGDPNCHFLSQYNEDGMCTCAPATCASCEGTPCCGKPCGTGCAIPGCTESTKECFGYCNDKYQCLSEQADCEIPK